VEKILIVGCRNAMDDVCIGCSRCLVAFNRRAGSFQQYAADAEILGLLNCGGCPGSVIVMRLAQTLLWNAPMGEKPTRVHIGPCISDHCPHAQNIVAKIKAKSGVEVLEGTHPYMPTNIFA